MFTDVDDLFTSASTPAMSIASSRNDEETASKKSDELACTLVEFTNSRSLKYTTTLSLCGNSLFILEHVRNSFVESLESLFASVISPLFFFNLKDSK